jgi:Na+/melibiose symporter-like transporter
MTTLIIISVTVLIFILMHLIAKKSKPLQYWIISIAIAFLLVSHFFQLEKNNSNFVLIIALIIFGNFFRKPRTSI